MQVLERLRGDFFAITDTDLALVCYGDCSVGSPALVGIAFRIGSRWRCLRHGIVDIGIEGSCTDAIGRIIGDHHRDIPELTIEAREALPLSLLLAAFLAFAGMQPVVAADSMHYPHDANGRTLTLTVDGEPVPLGTFPDEASCTAAGAAAVRRVHGIVPSATIAFQCSDSPSTVQGGRGHVGPDAPAAAHSKNH